MPKRVVAFTQTHNNEKTIARCMESVLRQTYGDIVYYVYDNASTDNTKKIIREYAQTDGRVRTVFCEDNSDWRVFSCVKLAIEEFNRNDCFIVLDSDDAYEPDAFEKLLGFMEKNRLDIAACPYDFIDAASGEKLNKSEIINDLIVTGEGFETHFSKYFRVALDSHGKMFTFDTLGHTDWELYDHSIMNGSTSYLAMEALGHSHRFGVLAERLYRYYIYPQSTERSGSKRMLTTNLYNYYKKWAVQKFGSLSEDNRWFLLGAYFRALSSRLLPLLKSNVSTADKLSILTHVFLDSMTVEMLNCGSLDRVADIDRSELLNAVTNWLKEQEHNAGAAERELVSKLMYLLEGVSGKL